jgi:hypothetical protein
MGWEEGLTVSTACSRDAFRPAIYLVYLPHSNTLLPSMTTMTMHGRLGAAIAY